MHDRTSGARSRRGWNNDTGTMDTRSLRAPAHARCARPGRLTSRACSRAGVRARSLDVCLDSRGPFIEASLRRPRAKEAEGAETVSTRARGGDVLQDIACFGRADEAVRIFFEQEPF